jgi:hypothetical protein
MARDTLTRTLGEAYARGLLSDDTFLVRMNQVLSEAVLDSVQLVGDVDFRGELGGVRGRFSESMRTVAGRLDELFTAEPSKMLALDWNARHGELVLGRSGRCDVPIDEATVSRRHARLWRQPGRWLVQDLQSTNGTFVNGRQVGRCELRPGDLLALGEARLRVD